MKAGETWMNSANAENRNAWKGTFGIIESCWAVCDTGGGHGLQLHLHHQYWRASASLGDYILGGTMGPFETEYGDKTPFAETADTGQHVEDAELLSPERRAALEKRMQGMSDNIFLKSDAREGKVLGDPEGDAKYLHPQTRDTCATVAQEGIIEKRTGVDHGEEALAQEAYEKGWTDEAGGTYPKDVGNLLEAHGIPTQRWTDGSASAETLKEQLSQGKDLIAGVDMGALYQDEAYAGVGHAVWVTGVETTPEGQISSVTVNDSNHPESPQTYDYAIFKTAWDGSHRLLVAAG